ncbi:hypothetical protein Gotur_030309 [Gossypium turneri]
MSWRHLFLIGFCAIESVAPSSFHLSGRCLFLLRGFVVLVFEVKPWY